MLPIRWEFHAQWTASHLRRTSSALYHQFVLSTAPLLATPRARDRFLSLLEQTREKYRFVVVGYVVMPEHIHLLVTEPEVGTPSTVMQVLKQRTAHALLPKRKRKDPRQKQLFALLKGVLLRRALGNAGEAWPFGSLFIRWATTLCGRCGTIARSLVSIVKNYGKE